MSVPSPPRCSLEKQGQEIQTGKLDATGTPGGLEGIAGGTMVGVFRGSLLETMASAQGSLC